MDDAQRPCFHLNGNRRDSLLDRQLFSRGWPARRRALSMCGCRAAIRGKPERSFRRRALRSSPRLTDHPDRRCKIGTKRNGGSTTTQYMSTYVLGAAERNCSTYPWCPRRAACWDLERSHRLLLTTLASPNPTTTVAEKQQLNPVRDESMMRHCDRSLFSVTPVRVCILCRSAWVRR